MFGKRRLTFTFLLKNDEFGFSAQRFYGTQTIRKFVYFASSLAKSVEYPAVVVDFVIDENESETVHILMNLLCRQQLIDFSHTLVEILELTWHEILRYIIYCLFKTFNHWLD